MLLLMMMVVMMMMMMIMMMMTKMMTFKKVHYTYICKSYIEFNVHYVRMDVFTARDIHGVITQYHEIKLAFYGRSKMKEKMNSKESL